ncbi:hypothetical protein C7447_102160 [Tenacibaculum adriaticum]|uniref:DUF4258 domain-containing protein n=1 Tax=Tenacibaculum adriaticum TaxID=413713 RepID=A0A5S5DT28_9FLAO|nr:DUF4258 domain-containing protein [Tenacibaculum adriaticum]TYP98844.1 hypothetical protein C7447_102160 [Tenacibaculum adriaticum]
MQLLKRFGYYFIGLALGSVAVLFFWKQKDVSFDYGMDARTLKTIRIRKRIFSEEAKQNMLLHKIDTAQISTILKSGDVDFDKSKPRQKPCAEYLITSKKVDLYVVRCDSTSTIKKVIVK